MRKFVIEVEETKAETIINLLATVSVKVGNVKSEEECHYVKLIANGYYKEDKFLKITEEQFGLLQYLCDEGIYEDWEKVDPEEMFEEV